MTTVSNTEPLPAEFTLLVVTNTGYDDEGTLRWIASTDLTPEETAEIARWFPKTPEEDEEDEVPRKRKCVKRSKRITDEDSVLWNLVHGVYDEDEDCWGKSKMHLVPEFETVVFTGTTVIIMYAENNV